MKVFFNADDVDERFTPIKVADGIIESECFTLTELKELVGYLSVYVSCHGEDENGTP